MTNAINCKAIIEVGCGPGFHSEFIAKNFLQKNSMLVSCDFSSKMMEMVQKRYENSDFTQLPGNVVRFDLATDFVQQNGAIVDPRLEEGESKLVFGCIADNMRLPFPDQHFDCYISNLSLMIVPDYRKQIAECQRVL